MIHPIGQVIVGCAPIRRTRNFAKHHTALFRAAQRTQNSAPRPACTLPRMSLLRSLSSASQPTAAVAPASSGRASGPAARDAKPLLWPSTTTGTFCTNKGGEGDTVATGGSLAINTFNATVIRM